MTLSYLFADVGWIKWVVQTCLVTQAKYFLKVNKKVIKPVILFIIYIVVEKDWFITTFNLNDEIIW